MAKNNIRGDLKKYQPANKPNSRRGRSKSSPYYENIKKIVDDFIPPSPPIPTTYPPTHEEAAGFDYKPFSSLEMQYKIEEMDRVIKDEEQRMASIDNPNILISPFKRTVYFERCGHKAESYINNIKLGTYYYCDKCVLFRRISEVIY